MALYEYRCVSCRHLTELFRRTDERDRPAECAHCGKAARRVFSVPQAWKAAWSTPRSGEELRQADELWER